MFNKLNFSIMPNWCSTAYVIEGDASEIKNLYELMKELQERKKPLVENGFGTAWLGCLVVALGKDWRNIDCRGHWYSLAMEDDTLRFDTETAWAPCEETLNLVCEKFPSLSYYYRTEEPGMCIYETNDSDGKYFPDRYVVDLCTVDEEYLCEYFSDLKSLFEWLTRIAGKPIQSEQDVKEMEEEWEKENPNSFCNINEFTVANY